MNSKIIHFFFCCIPYFVFCQYKSSYLEPHFTYQNEPIVIDLTGFYDVTKSLPPNYVEDGSVDYTEYIQSSFDKNEKIVMPNFPVCVTGVFPNSNSQIYFQEYSKLILLATNRERYQIIGLHGVSNIKIYNANLRGDYDKHLGESGEWGFGIDIRSSQNIHIYNSIVENCWGDGLIISETRKGLRKGIKSTYHTENIFIDNLKVDYVRRNGISIINGKKIYLKNVFISNVFGIAPKAGIDIEPDDSHGILNDVFLNNIEIFNSQTGIALFLDAFIDDEIFNTSNICISNVKIQNVQSAFFLSGFSNTKKAKKIKGNVEVANMFTKNVQIPIRIREKSDYFPKFYIKNFYVQKNNINYDDKATLLEKTKTDKNLILFK